MYTELKSYQIIIALLKEYGINQCSLGGLEKSPLRSFGGEGPVLRMLLGRR